VSPATADNAAPSPGPSRTSATPAIESPTVLDTTNKAIDSANTGFGAVNSNIGREIQRSIRQTNRRVKRQINRSVRQSSSNSARQKKLLHCVQHAHGNVNHIQRCGRKF